MNELERSQELLLEQLEDIAEAMSELSVKSEEYQKLEATYANINQTLLKTNQRMIEDQAKMRETALKELEADKKNKISFKWFVDKVVDVTKAAAPALIGGYLALKTAQIVSDTEDEKVYGRQTGQVVSESYKNILRKY